MPLSLVIANGQLVVGCPRFKSGLVTEVGAVFVYDDITGKTAKAAAAAMDTITRTCSKEERQPAGSVGGKTNGL